ncbi:glycosyltransferase family 4 protein [Iningainema tapete]|uniref:Glycosyltransferase family 4 protein n=1 Tax=Iningainema tapete BLCC-T55 TaxID=2748662 RepID=A0A8J7CAQ8_9CYAN|nr:glycosyltransferase family 4 protein [Iningainema tapete]MBD2771525.1 glycosyltransferase family 4 protein [Iningainema tapete BLCC-T55]
MRIGIISEAPSITTGFGVTCNQIIRALVQAGHYVACFGLGLFGETFDRSKFPCRIWAAGGYASPEVMRNLSNFIGYENLDLVLINHDLGGVQTWVGALQYVNCRKTIISHFVSDGLPICDDFLKPLLVMQALITATHSVANFLEHRGMGGVIVAPHGVDPNIFSPLTNRQELRQQAGLEGKFVVGVFGRNIQRKQQPRVMLAIQHLKKIGKASDIVLYLHCQMKDSLGWNLLELARDLEIEDKVIFPSGSFNQFAGVPYIQDDVNLRPQSDTQTTITPEHQLFISDRYNYVERLNCCDLVVNVPFCGGFELGVIEAQSCGVPVAATNDGGIMSEVVGEGGILLDPVDMGIWGTGARQFFVSPQTIAQTILSVKEDLHLQNELRSKGMKNASKYSWDLLKNAVVNLVQKL